MTKMMQVCRKGLRAQLLTIRYNRTALKDMAAKKAPTLFYRDIEPAIRKQDLDQMANGVEVQALE